jgi:hypothetical protein
MTYFVLILNLDNSLTGQHLKERVSICGVEGLRRFWFPGWIGDPWLPACEARMTSVKVPLTTPVEDLRMAVVRRLSLALLIGLVWSAQSSAQNPVPPTGTITGRVVDATTQQPVADVSVIVEGTRRGAVSGADGTFTIVGVPAGSQTVRARRIGFSGPVQIVVVPTSGSVTVVFPL